MVTLAKFTDGIDLGQATSQKVSSAELEYRTGETSERASCTAVEVKAFNDITALFDFFSIQFDNVRD
ncbi:hypothetical protein OG563_26585 [Nocardia vinacea]|uniref:Uncharacterized protein n=1 Tax=Nocardia vinacea TaxID=96468 RepID=A0ABZ1YIF1_9NOCA|nr:hypothetical protein [Nocardia vinacea]